MICKHENIITKHLTGGSSLSVELCLDCQRRRSLFMGCGRAYASRRSKWYREDQKEQMEKKNLQWLFWEEITNKKNYDKRRISKSQRPARNDCFI